MSSHDRKLANAPIVEAVVDIDCALPPSQDIGALEAPALETFGDRYHKLRTVYLEQHLIQAQSDAPPQHSSQRGIQALRFLQEDERQLVQVRVQGYSFNRLAPYTSLDDYLPEIERTWRLFIAVASPLEVRRVRLRYINRILLPTADEQVDLDRYFRTGPRLPDEESLILLGFLDRHLVVERETDNQVNIILTAQAMENGLLPVILDIEASRAETSEPADWASLLLRIQSLRELKNRVFRNTLTDQCLELFR